MTGEQTILNQAELMHILALSNTKLLRLKWRSDFYFFLFHNHKQLSHILRKLLPIRGQLQIDIGIRTNKYCNKLNLGMLNVVYIIVLVI